MYNGTTALNGGIAQAAIAENAPTSGPFGAQAANAMGTITFGGGTLQYSAANQNDYSARFPATAGAVSIDTDGQTVSFGTALTGASSLALSDSDVGAPGSLTLTGLNTYTNKTTVGAGATLNINGGSLGTTVATINPTGAINLINATVGATATSTATTINSGTVNIPSGTTTVSGNFRPDFVIGNSTSLATLSVSPGATLTAPSAATAFLYMGSNVANSVSILKNAGTITLNIDGVLTAYDGSVTTAENTTAAIYNTGTFTFNSQGNNFDTADSGAAYTYFTTRAHLPWAVPPQELGSWVWAGATTTRRAPPPRLTWRVAACRWLIQPTCPSVTMWFRPHCRWRKSTSRAEPP